MMPGPAADLLHALRALLAEGRYQEVLDRFAERRDPADRSDPILLLTVAAAATRLGHLDQGQELALGALAVCRSRADDDGRVRSENLLGAIAFARGQIGTATAHWRTALDLSRATGDILTLARASNNLASACHLGGDVLVARGLYRESLAAYQRIADRREIAGILTNLAFTFRWAGDTAAAATLGEDAVRHAEVVGDPTLLALVLAGRAETMLDLGEFAVAEQLLARSEQLATHAGDEAGVGEVHRVRAERWLRLGEPLAALESALAGRAVAERCRQPLLGAECSAAAARAAGRLGREAAADRYRAEAAAGFETLGAALQLARLREQ